MDIEIDTPEWFDLYVARPVQWLMRTDIAFVPNVWYVAALILVVIIVGSTIHRTRINRRFRERRAAAERANAEGRARDDESYNPFADKFTVPGDDT